MALKSKLFFIAGALAGLLFLVGFVVAQPLEASDNVSGREISLAALVPEQHHLTLISVSPVVVQGSILGAVAVYDDPTSQRAADYLELYDNAGNLLALSWFDRFGIERTAVDRGLLKSEELEGMFVVLLEGDSI